MTRSKKLFINFIITFLFSIAAGLTVFKTHTCVNAKRWQQVYGRLKDFNQTFPTRDSAALGCRWCRLGRFPLERVKSFFEQVVRIVVACNEAGVPFLALTGVAAWLWYLMLDVVPDLRDAMALHRATGDPL